MLPAGTSGPIEHAGARWAAGACDSRRWCLHRPPSRLSAVINVAEARSLFWDHWQQSHIPVSHKRRSPTLGAAEGVKSAL